MGIRWRLVTVVLTAVIPLLIFMILSHDQLQNPSAHLFVILAAGFCSIGAALLVARSTLRRVKLLDSAARQLGEGNYAARIPVEGSDEISQVAKTFNQMSERLEEREHRFIELDDLKSEFVGRVSHELRTPLTTIKALTRLLLRGEITDEKQREYLETISVECDRQIELVLNLLDLSRIEGEVYRLSIQRVRLSDIVVSCIKAQTYAAEKRSHKFKIDPFSAIPPVRADPNTLRRVLINLIENSVKYTPDGGLITLSARDEGDFATVSVKDNGRGIPHEDLPILFDKFYRGKPNFRAADTVSATTATDLLEDANVSGIGLGLYLARNVMEKMNGRISVETEVGRGSTFTLHLPVWRDSDLNGPMSEEKENGKTVVGS